MPICDGRACGSGGGGGSAELWTEAASIDYAAAAAHDFQTAASVVIDGVGHQAINPGNAGACEVNASGLQIVSSSTSTNFIPGTLTAARVLVSLEDAGVKSGDEWMAELKWSLASFNNDDYAFAGAQLVDGLNEAAGTDFQAVYMITGEYAATSDYIGAQNQATNFRAVRAAWDAAVKAAFSARVRIYGGRNGIETAGSSDNGATWLRGNGVLWAPDRGGNPIMGTAGEVRLFLGQTSFNAGAGFTQTLERLTIWHRPQPEAP